MDDETRALEAAFDMLAARAGIDIHPERRDGIFAEFLELTREAQLVRLPRPASAEPSNIFDLTTIMRAGE